MQRTMLQSKIHYATVTRAELCDESSYPVDGVFPCAGESPALHDGGSCAIDEALLEMADIRQYQQVEIYDVDKGERFTTCAMRAKRGSGIISLSGAAAQHAAVGDVLIIAAYGSYSDVELERYKPRLIYVDERNRVDDRRTKIPVRLG